MNIIIWKILIIIKIILTAIKYFSLNHLVQKIITENILITKIRKRIFWRLKVEFEKNLETKNLVNFFIFLQLMSLISILEVF